jgi:hypothetical protein
MPMLLYMAGGSNGEDEHISKRCGTAICVDAVTFGNELACAGSFQFSEHDHFLAAWIRAPLGDGQPDAAVVFMDGRVLKRLF